MIKARLFILGTERELLSTDLECYRTQNATTGRAGPIPMGGLVTLSFASGYGDDRLLYALTHSPENELCTLTTAKIVFYAGDLDGIVLFEYKLKDAAFVYWKEEFNATGENPMTVTLTISAAIQEIKGVTWVKPWRESEVPAEASVVRVKEGQRGVSDDCGKKEEDERITLKVTRESIKATGQAHHLLGHKITRALNNHPTLKRAFDYSRTNSKYIYNALDAAAHKGYQTWHRQYDATVVKWLQSNPSATPAQFNKYLHNLYQQPRLKSRIPNVKLLD